MPNQTEGYLGKARVLECLERYTEALEVYEQAGKMNLNTAQLSLQKGQLLELLGRDEEALYIFDEILQSPSNSEQKDISGPAYFGKQRVYERLARKARTQAQTLEYMGCFRLFRTLHVSEKVRNPARSMAFSLDGCFLSTSYYVYPTELWDLSSGKMLRTFKNINPDDDRAHRSSGDAYCVTFSPDGHSLACSGQKAATIWDLFSGNLLSVFEGANHVAFSPDGHSLASTSGTTIKLLELSSGQVRQTLSHPDALNNHYVAFSPDNRFLASAANEYMTDNVVLWELPSGKVLDIYKDSRCLAFSPDSRFLATGKRGTIDLWDISSGKRHERISYLSLSYYNNSTYDIAFGPDGRTLISNERDYNTGKYKMKLWDIFSKSERQTLSDLDISCIALSPDGYTLASGSGDGATIKLWRLL